MLLSCETRGTLLVLTGLKARVDAHNADDFKEQAREFLNTSTLDCALDLNRVNFMDSTGISVLVSLLKYIGPDRRLELCSLTPPIRKTLRLTRLDTVFSIRESVHKAELAQTPKATGTT